MLRSARADITSNGPERRPARRTPGDEHAPALRRCPNYGGGCVDVGGAAGSVLVAGGVVVDGGSATGGCVVVTGAASWGGVTGNAGGDAVVVVVTAVVVTVVVTAASGGGICGTAFFCSSYRFSIPLCCRLRISQRSIFDSLIPIRMSLIDS